GRIIIYKKEIRHFIILPLHQTGSYVEPSHTVDKQGNIWFSSNGSMFLLTTKDTLKSLPISSVPGELARSLLIDHSGVLWVGTNGYNLRQFDLRLPRMPAIKYEKNFFYDILHNNLSVPENDLNHSPIQNGTPYLFRSVEDKAGKIWMSLAGAVGTSRPNLCYYQNGRIFSQLWHYADTINSEHKMICGLAISEAGTLWGIDDQLQLIRMDTIKREAKIIARIPEKAIKRGQEVNSMLIVGESTFYVTTTTGFFRYELQSREMISFGKMIPGAEFTTLVKDSREKAKIWVGTKGDGLIHMNPSKGTFRLYTTENNLPNNTIYAILPVQGKLWCSSNKGIFSLDPKSSRVQSYSMLDGLPVDEFNRFHSFALPDGQIAFGGTGGYTIFSPDEVSHDDFHPTVALTGIRINNKFAGYAVSGSPLKKAINSLDTLQLSHQQNFLELEFAALEYNIPEKISYRYMMNGVDQGWIDAGTNRRATYTDLSPGTYRFKVIASNVAGIWGQNNKQLIIIIQPPYYGTWWFRTLMVMTLLSASYFIFKFRVESIRKRDKQKHLSFIPF
ncbi:MAG: hypothetical protein EOO88_42760, partial [Pedobacter sp.]